MDYSIKTTYNKEEWRSVSGFEDIYYISNYGRLKSFKSGNPKILSQTNKKNSYFSVILSYKGRKKSTRIHRLVYEEFIGKIPNGSNKQIHHINHNKQDNRVCNLMLLSPKEHRMADIESRNVDGMINYNKFIKTLKINQYSLDGVFIACYNNAQEASNITGVCARNILQVAKKTPFNKKGNIRKQAGGYIWKI